MLLYNWNRIFKTCKANTFEIVQVFKMMVEKQLPRNRYDNLYKYADMNFTGESFLVHPDVLLYNSYKYSYRDICIYLALASLRSYGEYKVNGRITLDPLHIQEDPQLFLDNNKLLYIENGEIHFLHEEVPTEIN